MADEPVASEQQPPQQQFLMQRILYQGFVL